MAGDREGAAGALRARLALACNILAMEGHTDISLGHASVREPGAAEYWIKGAGLGLEEVAESDLVLMDLDGKKLAGERPPHNELPIHAEIFRARPDACAVVHTHPPYATALGASMVPLRPVGHEGVLFVDIPRFVETTDLILTREQGVAVARTLGPHRALLLKNHGIVTAGPSIEEASLFAIFLERAARMQWMAACLGPYEWTDTAEATVKAAHIYHPRGVATFWAYYTRKLQRVRQSPA
jgi:L-fuculose-phosphate aldolase